MRGLGTFTDDIALPGMLHGAILRSPLAHARIVSVDTAAAEAHPKVRAVITGAMLEERQLAWMPTLSRDVQAVLATDKVRFQGQEVAFVVAEDGYAARDALELIDVEYEPLPVVADATRALDPGAPVIRDDLAGQPDNHIFDWSAGDEAATEAVFADGRRHRPPGHALPALAPGPAGDLRHGGRPGPGVREAHRVVHQPGPARAPHHVRAAGRAARAQDPDHLAGHRRRVRQQGADLPRVPVRRGRLDADRQAGQVGGGPVGEPDVHRVRPGLPHARGDRGDRDGRILGLRARVLADHGAFNGSAQPTKFPAGFFHIFTGSYDLRAAHCRSPACTRTRRPVGWRTPARSASPRGCTWSSGWSTCSPPSWAWTRPSCG